MNDRLFTLLCAIGVFVLFYGFFIGDAGRQDENAASRPLSTEMRANGYRALRDWLLAEKIPVESLRHRYDWLNGGDSKLTRTGNLLVISLPSYRAARYKEMHKLVEWVRAGNTVIVAAGLFDTPEWGVDSNDLLGDLSRLAQLDFQIYRPKAAGSDEASKDESTDSTATDSDSNADTDTDTDTETAPEFAPDAIDGPVPQLGNGRLEQPIASLLHVRGAHPLTAGVQTVSALSEFPSYKFTAPSPVHGGVIEVMDDVDTKLPVMWVASIGAGTVVVSGYGSILTNKLIGSTDNARLFANLIDWRLAPRGTVVFDDMHQGAASFYDADAFFHDARLHATFWWIIGVWFAWVMLRTRLRATPPRVTAPREIGFIRSIGNFFARTLEARTVAERLFAHLFNDIRRNLGWPANGEPVWPWLHGLSVVPSAEVLALEQMHARLASGRKVDLGRLQNLILHIRKQVL